LLGDPAVTTLTDDSLGLTTSNYEHLTARPFDDMLGRRTQERRRDESAAVSRHHDYVRLSLVRQARDLHVLDPYDSTKLHLQVFR
jgi:hypothetical protein